MIRRVLLLLFVVALVMGTSLSAEAGNRFRFRRAAVPYYRYYVPSHSTPAPQGYEYQTHRYEARTTTGYTMLFGI
ncbi:hypothetical protein [Blastopirellula marina]|uniref:Uncharacterized protein n=1 Tax=Blastopirellula marina TaxID=124 RepID=A0A2S8GP22_9BACT|nr:hypothetical protein [Blastopirellula marina]PQO46193.1 hypothetical protein C5Y93_09400 [Blastopirellula marina]